MSEKKFGKRFLAWALTMVLTLSLLPLNVLAEEVNSEAYEADPYDYDLEQLDADYYSLDGSQINTQDSGSGKTISFTKGTAEHCKVYYVEGPDGLDKYKGVDLENLPDLSVFSDSINHSNITGNYGILFFVAPEDGYALTNINGQGNTFNSIVDNEKIEECDFWLKGNRGNLKMAGFDDDLIKILVQKAKDAGCVAAFLYTRAANADGFSTPLDFHTEQLATLAKRVSEINGKPYYGSEKVKVGDIITYQLTVTYNSSDKMPVTYSNVKIVDERAVKPESTISLQWNGEGTQTVTVTYTVEDSDLTGDALVNRAELTYDYSAKFNHGSRTSKATAEASIATVAVVSYRFEGDVPSSAEVPAPVHYAEGTPVAVQPIPAAVPGYTFEGWTIQTGLNDDDITTDEGGQQHFVMPADNVVFVGKWSKNTDTVYHVKHYLQNLVDNEYTYNKTTTERGTTGDLTNASPETYTGFKVRTIEQKTIAGDGSTEVNICYDRETYNVSYRYTGDVPVSAPVEPPVVTYKYSATVSVENVPAAVTGYTFEGWKANNAAISGSTFTMPAANVEFTGNWAKISYGYTVNYVDKDTESVLDSNSQNFAPFGTVIRPTDASVMREFTDYTYTNEGAADLTITENESTNVITLYYTKKTVDYTIHHYLLGTDVEVAADQTGKIAVGETLTADKSNSLYSAYASATVAGYDSEKSITVTANGKNEITVFYKVPLIVTAKSASKSYDGSPLTESDFTVDGLVNKDTKAMIKGLRMTEESTITDAGTVDNVIDQNSVTGVEAYYEVEYRPGKLTVDPIVGVVVTIKGEKTEAMYDGTEKTASGYTVEINDRRYTEKDFTFSGNSLVKGIDVSDSGCMGLKAADFENKNSNFSNVTFSVIDGSLIITPRSVTLTSEGGSKTYDGIALTKPEVTIAGDGFVGDEVSDIKAIGSVTNVSEGEVTNTITYTENDGFKAGNYTITKNEGKLHIDPIEQWVIVKLQGKSDTLIYTGKEQSVSGYTVTALGHELYREEYFTFDATVVAKGTAVGSYEMPKAEGTDFRNHNENFKYVDFEFIPGKLTITAVHVPTHTLTVKYVYANGGEAAATHTETVSEGATYSVTSPEISGYTADKAIVSGTMHTENVEVAVTYNENRQPSRPSRPSRPSSSTDNTVTIEDDDALGLNTTDHFAYIVGYGNGEVRPQNNITRAEVATIFFRLLTDDVRDENLTKTNRYSDVAATSWYNTAVSTLSSMGIITGYPDGTFRPNAAITRAEFAAIAARFDPNGDTTAAKFSDIASHWAKDEISIAYNNGWITGYPDGTFGPQRDITRAETMTLVNRVLNRLPETEDDLLPNMTVWTDNANPKAWYYLAVQEATNSHYYEFKTNSQYEKWTELRETRDWSQLEK